MNIEEERKAFIYELDGHGYTFTNMKCLCGCFEDNMLNMAWEMWQASANREGFVLVPKEPTEEICKQLSGNTDNAKLIYKAMLSAQEQSNESN